MNYENDDHRKFFGKRCKFRDQEEIRPDLQNKEYCLVGYSEIAISIVEWRMRGSLAIETYSYGTEQLMFADEYLFRPSNGTVGERFFSKWCAMCKKYDKEDGCNIHFRTLFFDIENDEYPAEWTRRETGEPICTAFDSR